MNVGETSTPSSGQSLQKHEDLLRKADKLRSKIDGLHVSEQLLQKQKEYDALLLKAAEVLREIDGLTYAQQWFLKPEDHDALLLKARKLRRELDDLQTLNDRMCGEGVEAMTLTDLRSLQGQLQQGLDSVRVQLALKTRELEEFERSVVKQELGEEEDTHTPAGKQLIRTKRQYALLAQKRLTRSRTLIRKLARRLRTRGETTSHWDDSETLIRAFSYMENEIPRLVMLNRRMVGEEIESLDYSELIFLRKEINHAMVCTCSCIVKKLMSK
ncbi:unnamed protein product [Microthlaspi erraticum]|uniref:K-box domain-containing protein n=1 Tax=Microthlaspi erraticum TaxID=1685480 RepID=A0A6D2LBX8_9BRAS|nr:unnamed protein product [Microthlaspi erraticum]